MAIRVRPPDVKGGNYARLLSLEYGFEVENRAVPASMVSDVDLGQLESVESYDAFILHFGIVEASNRSVGRALYQYLNRPSEEISTIERPLVLVLLKLESMFRSRLVRLRGSRGWIDDDTFSRKYRKLVSALSAHAPVICVGINTPSQRVEDQLPGSSNKVSRFNQAIRDASESTKQYFVDSTDLIRSEDMPDGIHFNVSGHQKLARAINSLLV
ncbi:MAG: SGNH/GDSL hydrolase family protein [Rhodothermales bacterium]|nr:SGNH/GDSL hydrolase family protein [Rhodothermales bacterium]